MNERQPRKESKYHEVNGTLDIFCPNSEKWPKSCVKVPRSFSYPMDLNADGGARFHFYKKGSDIRDLHNANCTGPNPRSHDYTVTITFQNPLSDADISVSEDF